MNREDERWLEQHGYEKDFALRIWRYFTEPVMISSEKESLLSLEIIEGNEGEYSIEATRVVRGRVAEGYSENLSWLFRFNGKNVREMTHTALVALSILSAGEATSIRRAISSMQE